MAAWVRVCNVADFRVSYLFRHRRREYALFKLDDGVYCIDNVCSHEYSSLSDGMVVDGHVYCAKHGSRFDIRTGAVRDLPATAAVKTFDVKVDEQGEVFINA